MLDDLEKKKILFFSPHPDDDVFSGGALLNYLSRKNKVYSVYVTYSPRGVTRDLSEKEKIQLRKSEAIKASKVLNINPIFLGLHRTQLEEEEEESVDIILKFLKEEKPDLVFIPSIKDAHFTHRKVSEVVLEAIKSFEIKEIWFYETWTPLTKPDYIFFFNDTLMNKKIEAMKKHKSQVERLNYTDSMVALNRFRGIMGQELMGGFGKSYDKERYGEAFKKAL